MLNNNLGQTTEKTWHHDMFGPTPGFLRDAFMFLFTAQIASISILSLPGIVKSPQNDELIKLEWAGATSLFLTLLITISACYIYLSIQKKSQDFTYKYTAIDTISCSLLSITLLSILILMYTINIKIIFYLDTKQKTIFEIFKYTSIGAVSIITAYFVFKFIKIKLKIRKKFIICESNKIKYTIIIESENPEEIDITEKQILITTKHDGSCSKRVYPDIKVVKRDKLFQGENLKSHISDILSIFTIVMGILSITTVSDLVSNTIISNYSNLLKAALITFSALLIASITSNKVKKIKINDEFIYYTSYISIIILLSLVYLIAILNLTN